MRLGRPIAALSVGATILGASLVAAPAMADESTDSQFDLAEVADAISPSETALTVSGTGCTGPDATVAVALLPPSSTDVSNPVKVTPAEDGSWTATLNIAESIKASGVDPYTDGWSIVAACGSYQNVTGSDAEGVVFDDTEVTGKYTISGEAGAQTFTIEVGGFSAGETATAALMTQDGTSTAAVLGDFPIDENGNGTGSFPAPSLPDGTYQLVITGSRYGEVATSKKLIQVSGGVYTAGDDNTQGGSTGGGSGDGNVGAAPGDAAAQAPASSNGTGATVSVTAGATQAAAPARGGDSALARTGTNGLVFGGIALALVAIGGGVLWARRRKAS